MSWHSAWNKTILNNNDVKYLLADCANAIQERYRLRKQTSCNFITFDSTGKPNVTNTDFLKTKVTVVKNQVQKIVDNLELLVIYDYPTYSNLNIYCTDSSSTDFYYSLENLINEVGMMQYEDFILLNWKDFYFWQTLKAAIQKLRYFRIDITTTAVGGTVEVGDVSSANGADGETPQIAWDSLTATVNDSIVSYAMEGVANVGWTTAATYLGNCDSTVFYGWKNMKPKRVQSCVYTWEPVGIFNSPEYEILQDSVISVGCGITASSSCFNVSDTETELSMGGLAAVNFDFGELTFSIPACSDNDSSSIDYDIDLVTLSGELEMIMDELTTIPAYPTNCDNWVTRWGFSCSAGVDLNATALIDVYPQLTYQ